MPEPEQEGSRIIYFIGFLEVYFMKSPLNALTRRALNFSKLVFRSWNLVVSSSQAVMFMMWGRGVVDYYFRYHR